jgi:hypothetical protein
MATALREMEEAREKLEIRSGRRFAGEKIAVGLVILLGLCHAMRAAWAQEVAPSKLQISSPVPEATGGFQATFPAYRIRLRDKTELGAVPALEVYRNEQLIFRFPLVSGLVGKSSPIS